jgi:hypothetical protein
MVVKPFVVLSTERKQVVGVWPVRSTRSGHALAVGFLAEDFVEIVANSIEWPLLPVRETTRACPLFTVSGLLLLGCCRFRFLGKADLDLALKNACHVFLSSPYDRNGSLLRHLAEFTTRA